MAPNGDEEVEYESDPEEVKRSLAMRRREASDDEESELARKDDDGRRGNRRTEVHVDESDGHDGTAEYEINEDEGLGVDGEEMDDSYDEEEEYIEEGYDDEGDVDGEQMLRNDNRSLAGSSESKMVKVVEGNRPNGEEAMKDDGTGDIDEEEGKEKQPFAVPTAGAFYMHDDRFQEDSGGRHRRMRGGRRLWESKDDGRWGHDKFEEMNTRDKHYERRGSRGRFRGRGRKGQERGYSRGNSSKEVSDNGKQKQFAKVVSRGRGLRRYEPTLRNGNQAPSAQNKQSRNSLESVPTATASEFEAIQGKKYVVASSLNSASPPFYPSGSSNSMAQKDIQAGMGRLHINESASPAARNSGNTKSSSSGQPSAVSAPLSSPETESASEAGALVAKGKGTLQPSGKGSHMYGGTQVMGPPGSLAVAQGNPNFPAFLPLMPFGGQQGGVPTFGMAFPGYVQSEHGVANPEMTWLPILAGPGGMGATYCPPYAAIDGSYQACKAVLPSSAGPSSKENITNKLDIEQKASDKAEIRDNGILQRQNNPKKQPRRYSEMSFSR